MQREGCKAEGKKEGEQGGIKKILNSIPTMSNQIDWDTYLSTQHLGGGGKKEVQGHDQLDDSSSQGIYQADLKV